MSVQVDFRNIEPTEAIKSKVSEKVAKFSKFVNYPIEVHVILSCEKLEQRAEITCHAEHRDFVAEARTKDLYESIDQAVNKMETQLRKEKDQKKGHHTAHLAARPSSLKEGSDVQVEVPHAAKKGL